MEKNKSSTSTRFCSGLCVSEHHIQVGQEKMCLVNGKKKEGDTDKSFNILPVREIKQPGLIFLTAACCLWE